MQYYMDNTAISADTSLQKTLYSATFEVPQSKYNCRNVLPAQFMTSTRQSICNGNFF